MSAADTDTKFTALALIYGKPDSGWLLTQNPLIPLAFRIALEKVFEPEEVKRVGLHWFAYDYASWYERNNHVPEPTR